MDIRGDPPPAEHEQAEASEPEPQAEPVPKAKRPVSEKQRLHLESIRGKALAAVAAKREAEGAKRAEAAAKRAEIAARKEAAAAALLQQETLETRALEKAAKTVAATNEEPVPEAPKRKAKKVQLPVSSSDSDTDSERAAPRGKDRLQQLEQEVTKLRYKLKYAVPKTGAVPTAAGPVPVNVEPLPQRQRTEAPQRERFTSDLAYFQPFANLGI